MNDISTFIAGGVALFAGTIILAATFNSHFLTPLLNPTYWAIMTILGAL